MKIVAFRVENHNRRKRSEGRSLNIERILFVSFIATFVILILAQTALITPSVRTFLAGSTEVEGRPLGIEEYLYNEGMIGLELIGNQPNSDVKILVNGDEIAVFSNSVINIAVKDGDIVEIDGSSVEDAVEIAIVSKTDNVKDECANKRITVESDVKMLTQIRVE